MAEKDALEYLQGQLKDRIASFDEKRKSYRQSAERIAITSSLLSALTTVLIGIGQIYEIKPLSVAALSTSALVGVVGAFDGFYTYRKRWVQNNDTLMQLYELRSRIKYQSALKENLSQEDINNFHEQYQRILRDANEGWKQDRSVENI